MKKHGNWFWGVFLVLAGVLLVTTQFAGFQTFGFWSVAAGVLLLAVLVQSIVSRSFVGITLSLVLLYIVFWRPLGLPQVSSRILLLAALLAGIGLSMLLRKKPRYNWQYQYNGGGYIGGGHAHPGGGAPAPQNGGVRPAMEADANSDDNHPYAKVSFGAASRYLHSTALENGQFICSFGSMEVYFDQAQLSANGAEIYLDCSFGAIKLYLPKNWNVEYRVAATLGGVNNDDRFAQPDRSLPKLVLGGSVQLGGIEVVYV